MQAEHLLPRARPQGDAVSARGRLQRCERVIAIELGEIGHAFFFDERALARQALQDAPDDLRQQGLQLFHGGCARFMEHRGALAAGAIHAVEHQAVREYFGADLRFGDQEDFRAEVYPGHSAPIIRKAFDEGKPQSGVELTSALFGLIPSWSKDGKNYRHTYNARTETVYEKPSYRTPWKKRQFCVVPMDAFYEPNYETGKPVRWRIERKDKQPILVGAIWDVWKNPQDHWLRSFSMLTINADNHDVMKQFHPPNDEKRALVMLERDQVND